MAFKQAFLKNSSERSLLEKGDFILVTDWFFYWDSCLILIDYGCFAAYHAEEFSLLSTRNI